MGTTARTTYDSEVMLCLPLSYTALIFTKGGDQDPVNRILDVDCSFDSKCKYGRPLVSYPVFSEYSFAVPLRTERTAFTDVGSLVLQQ